MLFRAQLTPTSLQVAHGEVVVAMKTLEGTSAGYLDGNFQRSALTRVVLMDGTAKAGICGHIHAVSAIDPCIWVRDLPSSCWSFWVRWLLTTPKPGSSSSFAIVTSPAEHMSDKKRTTSCTTWPRFLPGYSRSIRSTSSAKL